MELKFISGKLATEGKLGHAPDVQWWKLNLKLANIETDYNHSISVTLPLPNHPDSTTAELDEHAQNLALSILQETARLLIANPVASLRAKAKAENAEFYASSE